MPFMPGRIKNPYVRLQLDEARRELIQQGRPLATNRQYISHVRAPV